MDDTGDSILILQSNLYQLLGVGDESGNSQQTDVNCRHDGCAPA